MKRPLDPPITLDELLGRCMGDIEFSRNILQGFVSSSQAQLDEIASDLADGQDHLSIAKKVHRLKGTAATVAAGPLLGTLQELEHLLRNEETGAANIDQLTEQAMQQFRQIRDFANSGAL